MYGNLGYRIKMSPVRHYNPFQGYTSTSVGRGIPLVRIGWRGLWTAPTRYVGSLDVEASLSLERPYIVGAIVDPDEGVVDPGVGIPITNKIRRYYLYKIISKDFIYITWTNGLKRNYLP